MQNSAQSESVNYEKYCKADEMNSSTMWPLLHMKAKKPFEYKIKHKHAWLEQK